MKSKSLLKVFLFTLLISVSNLLYGQVLPQDSIALVELYNSTDGENWTDNSGWLTGTIDGWYGISTGLFDDNRRVVRINMPYNRLKGTLPESLGNLTELLWLDLKQNYLTGPIPSSIGNLTKLLELELNINGLNGELPRSIGNMESLTDLALFYNNLTGSIPDEIGDLHNLEYFSCAGNNLTGSIPASIGNLLKVKTIGLSGNNLESPLPSSLTNLDQLTGLGLSNNEFTGNIPDFLGQITTLVGLDLDENQFIGSLPESFGNLESVIRLNADHNQLSGELPISTLVKMQSLEFLNLSSNFFEGEIPYSINQFQSIKSIDLGSNLLSGDIPASIGDLVSLETLALTGNGFTSVPVEINNLTNLGLLQLGNNELQDIPVIQGLDRLSTLSIDYNRLTFKDIIPVLNSANFVFYSPQKTFGFERTVLAEPCGTRLIDWYFTEEGSQLQWFRNNQAIAGANSYEFEVNLNSQSDYGKYELKITNPDAPDLTILYHKYFFPAPDSYSFCSLSPELDQNANQSGEFFKNDYSYEESVLNVYSLIVRELKGEVVLARGDEEPVELVKGEVLFGIDRILTDSEGIVELSYSDCSKVVLPGNTNVLVSSFPMGESSFESQLWLDWTEIYADIVSESDEKPEFEITTINGSFIGRGTNFSVKYDTSNFVTTAMAANGSVTVIPENSPEDSILLNSWEKVMVNDDGIGAVSTFTLNSINVFMDTLEVCGGRQVLFSAVGYDAQGNGVSVKANWEAEGGSIDSKGLYTAGQYGGYYKVTATEPVHNLSASSVVYIDGWAVGKQELSFDSGPSLSQNYPNPFKTLTTIEYELPYSGHVMLKVLNILGEEVAEIVNEPKEAGKHSVRISSSNLENGTYFYKLQLDEAVAVKKMFLLR